MILEVAKQEFLVRYYWWAKNQIGREFDESFVLLEKLKQSGNPPTLRFMDYAENIDPQIVKSTMIAMLKRRMKNVAEFANESFNQEDGCLCNSYFEFGPRSKIIKAENNIAIVERKHLRNILKARLEPLLGDKITKYGAGTWRYSTQINSWIVGTTIDTAGKLHALSYSHCVGTKECPDLLSDAAISIQSWLGVAGGPTYWLHVNEDNIYKILSLLAEVVSNYLNAASALLNGLNLD
jgi:hypothetical protein